MYKPIFLPSLRDSLARKCWNPATDVYRTSHGWIIKMELAGVRPGDVTVETRGRMLLVSGQRRDVVIEAQQQCQSLEISYDSFERRIELPTDLTNMQINSDFEQGMLLIRIETS